MYHEPAGSQRMQGNPLDAASGRFVHGADSLTNAISAALPAEVVRLNEAVTSIDGSGSTLVVSTTNATYRARHVIMAMPPALAVHAIAFTPELEDQFVGLAKITPVWMGAITKIVVRYHETFWRHQGLAGSAMSHYGPMREIHDMSGPDGSPAALFGFASAAAGEPTATESQVIEQLVEIFGPRAGEPIEVFIHDWRHEQFTSPPGVEGLAAYQTYGHELYQQPAMDARLHWSSTETARQSPGHIDGAIASAHRVAAAIRSTLKPKSITPRSNP